MISGRKARRKGVGRHAAHLSAAGFDVLLVCLIGIACVSFEDSTTLNSHHELEFVAEAPKSSRRCSADGGVQCLGDWRQWWWEVARRKLVMIW